MIPFPSSGRLARQAAGDRVHNRVQKPRWTSSVEILAGSGYGSPPFNVRHKIRLSSAAGAASGALKSSRSDWLAPGAFGGLTSVRGCLGTRAW